MAVGKIGKLDQGSLKKIKKYILVGKEYLILE